MLSIILTILKIIGITVLALIGILLLGLLAILFVPIRYRVKASYGEVPEVDAVVSWLFHFAHARIQYLDNKFRVLVRILGILVYDSLKPKKPKINNSKKAKTDDNKNISETVSTDPVIHKGKDNNDNHNITDIYESKDVNHDEKVHFDTSIEETSLQETDTGQKAETEYNEPAPTDNFIYDEKDSEETQSRLKRILSKIKSFFEKIKKFFKKLFELFIKVKSGIVSFVRKTKSRIKKLIETVLNIRHKYNLILDFIKNETNKEGFRFTYDSIKKLLKHIKPTKLKARLRFGTGDPCSTGQILGIFGILYGFYGNALNITPDFENKVLEGSLYARGRIRLWTVLIIVIRFLLDKRFKELKMNYQLLKEAL